MKCPQCELPVSSLKTRLSANKDYPAICHQCRSEFYVHRYLSGMVLHGFIGTGMVFLALFLAFESAEWLGVLLLVLLTGLFWMALAFIESQHFQVHQVTRSSSESNPSLKMYLWVIIWVSVAVVIFAWLL